MTNRRSAPPTPAGSWWREGAVVAVAFALCLLGGALRVDDTVTSPPATAYVLAAVSSGLLAVRLRAPVAIVIATTLCGVLVAPTGLLLTPLMVAPTAISAYSLAVRTEGPVTPAVLLPAAALLVAGPPFFEADFSWADTGRLATVAATPLVAAVLGRSTRHRRAYLTIVEDRARRAEETLDDEARRRVAGERLRIARELHDLVAHHVSSIVLRVGVARHVPPDVDAYRAALDDVHATGSDALQDLRDLVSVLRAPGASDTALLGPDALDPALRQAVERCERAGFDVTGAITERGGGLDSVRRLAVLRIVQESLTNVMRHAPAGAAVEVDVRGTADHVEIGVSNDGVARPCASGPPGHGLIGMAERVTVLGGTFSAGPTPTGWHVAARLPRAGSGAHR